MRGVLAALLLLLLLPSPAFALTLEEEAVAIEVACNGLELGETECACIVEDVMAGQEPRMRELVLMSLADDVGFIIRARSGEFPREEIVALDAYQVYVQTKCAVGAYGE